VSPSELKAAASPEAMFAAVLAAEPTRPLVTFYDDESGERGELSARSCANWVAKTHFLLTDALGLGVGDAAFVDLPAHWISVPILFGCWSAGLTVVSSAEAAAVAFVTPTSAARAAGVPDVFAIAPDSVARGFGDHPPVATNDSVQDYVVAVRPQPDAWGSVHYQAQPGDPAIDAISRTDVCDLARARAAKFGLEAGARVLSTRAWGTADDWADDWIDTVLAPLSVGGSLVLVGHANAAKGDARIQQERITAVL
jgi:uncharacterized protein (TIGR03089 family)